MKNPTSYLFVFSISLCFTALIVGCKSSPTEQQNPSCTITKAVTGTIFHWQESSTSNGVPNSSDSARVSDTIRTRDTTIAGRSISIFDPFNYSPENEHLIYESDGNISVLTVQGDQLWLKLPVACGATLFTIDTVVSGGAHWIFTAKQMGSENVLVGSQTIPSIKVVVTWDDTDKKGPFTGIVETFTFWFAPSIGYFVRTETEYAPGVNGPSDFIYREDLID
jgi:hypothetical protein